MKEYNCPEVKVIEVLANDVLTTSGEVGEIPNRRGENESRAIRL